MKRLVLEFFGMGPRFYFYNLFFVLVLCLPQVSNAAICGNWAGGQNDSDVIGTTGNHRDSAKFTATQDCVVSSISALFKKNGTPVDNLTFDVYTDSGGVPSTLVGNCGNIVGSTLSVGFLTATLTCTGSVTLTGGTVYHLVMGRSGSFDASNNYTWGFFDDAAGRWASDNGTWTAHTSTEGIFEIDGAAPSSGTATSTASSTAAFSGYLPSKQEDLFMFGLIIFLLSVIALRTMFFSV